MLEQNGRLPGLESARCGVDTLMGFESSEQISVKDFLNVPADSSDVPVSFRVHDAMEVKLGLF